MREEQSRTATLRKRVYVYSFVNNNLYSKVSRPKSFVSEGNNQRLIRVTKEGLLPVIAAVAELLSSNCQPEQMPLEHGVPV